MSALSQVQIEEIEKYWNDEGSLNREIAQLVPLEVRQMMRKQAAQSLIAEGHIDAALAEDLLDPMSRKRHYWGGELATRALAHIRAVAPKYIEKYRTDIHQAICVKLNYKELRSKGALEKEPVMLCVAVADALLPLATGLPIPVTALSVYLVKSRLLDPLCGCSAS